MNFLYSWWNSLVARIVGKPHTLRVDFLPLPAPVAVPIRVRGGHTGANRRSNIFPPSWREFN